VAAAAQVASRTWPGINKPGGAGKVANVWPWGVDVKYVLGGFEKGVDFEWVQPCASMAATAEGGSGLSRGRGSESYCSRRSSGRAQAATAKGEGSGETGGGDDGRCSTNSSRSSTSSLSGGSNTASERSVASSKQGADRIGGVVLSEEAEEKEAEEFEEEEEEEEEEKEAADPGKAGGDDDDVDGCVYEARDVVLLLR
jgi:hypothetical protein